MYRIAVCDDERNVCLAIEEMLNKYQEYYKIFLEVEIFYTGINLQKYLNSGIHIDILFLDIELMNISGIQVGHYIRYDLKNYTTQIVYISYKQSYAVQLFKTQPFDFLVKPICQKTLFNVLESILRNLENKNQVFEFLNRKDMYRIPFNDILYFSSYKHKVIIV